MLDCDCIFLNYLQQVPDKIGQSLIVPEVGLAFESEDDAYEMYNMYAVKNGFSIRRSSTKRREFLVEMDKICKKRISCREKRSREGKFDNPSCTYITKGNIYCTEVFGVKRAS
jgi:hypothetical protein